MALMVGSLYDALKSAGVDGFDGRIAGAESRLALVQWMVGTNIAIALTILWRVFS